MAGPFVEALKAEIANLEAALAQDLTYRRLLEARRMLALYQPVQDAIAAGSIRAGAISAGHIMGNAIQPTALRAVAPNQIADPPRSSRRSSPDRAKALDAARMFLANRTSEPTPTSVIYDHVAGLGIPIAGEKPQNNLSAMLSNASDIFRSHGRSGWTLRSEHDTAETGPDLDRASHQRADEALHEQVKHEIHERTALAESLRKQIADHDRRYYEDDAPTISDAEYDALRQRLAEHST